MRPVYLCLFVLVVVSSCTKIPGSGDNKGPIIDPDSLEFEYIESDSISVGNELKIDMEQFLKKVTNVPYASDVLNEHQQLDIIYPEETIGPYKVIVVFHGGGWTSGDKQSESVAPIFEVINQGYAIISVNHRLSRNARWPAQLHDAKAAIRFIRENADMYRLDAEKIVVWGVSSGGHLAMMLGATNDQPQFEDLTMGSADFSSFVDGVISWYGVSDLATLSAEGMPLANRLMGFNVKNAPEKTIESSPYHLVTEKYPPLLLVHGTEDQIFPYQQSVDMLHRVNLKTGDLRAELVTFEEAGHADPMMRTSVNVLNNLDFADKIYYKEVNPYRTTVVKDIKLDFDAVLD